MISCVCSVGGEASAHLDLSSDHRLKAGGRTMTGESVTRREGVCRNTQRDLLNVYELMEIRVTPSYPLEICIVFRAGESQECVNIHT